MLSANFERVWVHKRTERKYSLDSLSERMRANAEAASWSRSLDSWCMVGTRRLRRSEFRLPSGTAVVSAVAVPARTECVVSIVVPVFNERSTFQSMMDALPAKQIPGMRKEIIIVESNSTDGSRDLVKTYEGRARRAHPVVSPRRAAKATRCARA